MEKAYKKSLLRLRVNFGLLGQSLVYYGVYKISVGIWQHLLLRAWEGYEPWCVSGANRESSLEDLLAALLVLLSAISFLD